MSSSNTGMCKIWSFWSYRDNRTRARTDGGTNARTQGSTEALTDRQPKNIVLSVTGGGVKTAMTSVPVVDTMNRIDDVLHVREVLSLNRRHVHSCYVLGGR